MLILKSCICIITLLTLYSLSKYIPVSLKFAQIYCATINPGVKVSGIIVYKRPIGSYSDNELVNAVCQNDHQAIIHLFYKKCLPTFQYHIYKLFPYKEDVRDLVDELFLYLFEDNWRRLKTFDSTRATLATWMSVTSFRFFKAYKHSKIDSNGIISTSDKWESFVGDWVQSHDAGIMIDINNTIDDIVNERDREIARLIFIEDKEFQVIADRFDLSIDYVYTVKNRLVKQLKTKLNSYL